jgi:hypothetical protein
VTSTIFEDPDDEDNNELAADQLATDPINPDLYAFAHRLTKSAPLKKVFRKGKISARTPEKIVALAAEVEEYLRNLFRLPLCFAQYNGQQGQFANCSCLNSFEHQCSYADLASRLGELFLFLFL